MNKYFEHPLAFPLMGIIITVGVLGVGVHIWYVVDSSVDFSILSEQIATNQTFVDSLECDDIILSINTLKMILSPTQQNEVKQLQSEFEDLFIKKECKI